LIENLDRVDIPTGVLTFHDMSCCNSGHYDALNDYMAAISNACADACMKAVPRASEKQVDRRIAGWSEYVAPVREKSLFWHQLWVECSRPRSGAVANCMRRTRAAYLYTVRSVKKDEMWMQHEQMAQCMLSSDDRNCWAEVKKIRGNRSGRSRVVDGMSNDSSIADVFVQSYKELFLYLIISWTCSTYRISRKINDKIMPQKLGGGRLIHGSILARHLDLLLQPSCNFIIAH